VLFFKFAIALEVLILYDFHIFCKILETQLIYLLVLLCEDVNTAVAVFKFVINILMLLNQFALLVFKL